MNQAAVNRLPTPVEQEVQRIRALLRVRQFEDALTAAEALASQVPENRDVLFLVALAQRQLNRFLEALATLARLEQHHPGYSHLYAERGHCYIGLKDAPRAIDAFLRAVNLNPALPASWSMLEGLYRMNGSVDNARTAAAHVTMLASLPTEVVQATGLFSDGELTLAESLIRGYLIKNGNHVEAMRLLARIALKREVYDDAELLLEAVLSLAPEYRAARYDYAVTLVEQHRYPRAREELEKLLKLDPGNREFRTLHASALAGMGENEQAVRLFRQVLSEAPRDAHAQLMLAHSLKTLGRAAEAIEAYRAATLIRPSFGEAYWSLANLKTYRFTDEEIARMQREEAAPATPFVDRFHLCFALGKALEDRAEYPASWDYYQRGNHFKREQSRYRPAIIENNTRGQIEVFTREFLDARMGTGSTSPEPIFIVGLPRSGSTLIEQILASHSRVEGTQELADIQRIVLELQGRDPDFNKPRYPYVLRDLQPQALLALGERYLKDTRAFRKGKPHFIDKMPNNFRHLGLIHLILPNARIIDARREPMACCFSNLKQLFANGQEFTYSIEDIARYYRTYLELMRHWDQVLPGRVLRVLHEDVVEDLEGSVRRVLAFCGLEFEPGCVEFHRTERNIRTASSEQVRQPIFREGLDQWKHYEPWLGPLQHALGDALENYRK